jgi:dTDP-4-dehydrorhamnose reductase
MFSLKNMKKLLVIGGSGLVGSSILQYNPYSWDISATYNLHPQNMIHANFIKIDLLDDANPILDLIEKIQPDFVVHAVAYPSVDFCEDEHLLADKLHVDKTQKISEICKKIDSKLLFLSTDAVFEGELNKKYIENDPTNPVNYYGQTKLRAEKIVLNSSKNNVVLRTAVVYGYHKKSRFTNWILDYLQQNKVIDPFIDQYNTPTLVNDLVKSIFLIFQKDISGLFHATGPSCVNRFEFAMKLAEKFNYDKSLIKPVTSKEKKQDAPRPISTCLNSKKLEQAINFQFTNLEDGISLIFNKSN